VQRRKLGPKREKVIRTRRKLKMAAFWNVAPRSLVETDATFQKAVFLLVAVRT
jgi:hypothetical protein